MSSAFVALDQPELWERWRLGAGHAGRAAGGPARLPTVDDLERLHDSARDEGRAEGLAEGRRLGAAEAARLKLLLGSLEQARKDVERDAAEDLLTLALDIARQLLQEALPVRRELLLPVVREAMRALPALAQPAQLVLNPADVELVRAHLGEELRMQGWQVVEDHRIQPGGCRLSSPNCEVDATLSNRWKRVLATLGRDHGWIDG
jgi:flagellar assembly protein FliH